MQILRVKPPEFQGIQWDGTAETWEKIIALGAKVSTGITGKAFLGTEEDENLQPFVISDWILKDEDGHFDVVSDKIKTGQYEKSPGQ